MRKLLNAGLLALPIAVLTGCDSTPPPPAPTTLELSRSAVEIDDGDTLRLAVTVKDQRGRVMDPLEDGFEVLWESDDTAVVTVEQGLIAGVRPGETRVVVSAGGAEASAGVLVRYVPASLRPAGGGWQEGVAGAPLSDSVGVRVRDRHGTLLSGVLVRFEPVEGSGTVSPSTPTTGVDGVARTRWTLGPSAGEQVLEVRVDGVRNVLRFRSFAAAGPPAAVRRAGGDSQAGAAGAQLPLPLVALVADEHGNPTPGVVVDWAATSGGGSVSPAQTTTDSAGQAQTAWTLGSEGEQTAAASVGSLEPVVFTASLGPSLGGPVVSSISPAILTPGATAAIQGENFSDDAAQVSVTVAGVAAQVTAATPTSISVTVPERRLLPCHGTRDVTVVVSVAGASGGRSHPLKVAVDREISPGGSATFTHDQLACNGLPAGGNYLIAATNTSTVLSSLAPFRLRATGAEAAGARERAREVGQQPGRPTRRPAFATADAALHTRVLASSRATLRAHGDRVRGGGARHARQHASDLAVNDTIEMKIPNLTAYDLCSTYSTVRARVVHAGDRAIALEDVAAPLAGEIDDRLRAVAEEYERDMHPLLLENFGDPLAVDELTDGDGKLYMLFSTRVNDFGLAGFVWGGNFVPPGDCAASNRAEIFFARLPTQSSGGFSADTPDYWSWTIRAVLIHEVKHLASYAERLAALVAESGGGFEELWLEEGTARVAEEIWARELAGQIQSGNVGYGVSLYCEFRPTDPGCGDRPLVMANHFDGLYRYNAGGGRLSPLGPTGSSDNTFYGSAWALARWAVDHAGRSESSVLRALTTGRENGSGTMLAGADNLAARVGSPFPALLQAWALAMALDDRPGFTPTDARHTFPGWDTPDVFEGMNGDFPDYWPHPSPFRLRPVPLDGTTQSISDLPGGASVLFDLESDGSAAIAITGPGGTPVTPELQVTVVRVR